ncbi:hypothetical protein JOF28_001656 [Leucobacter exalbidus]|uniref:Uncharacterized protein n=1 Tax=Leucobacter exalbidus TaxID=662960 RepID=A0A940PW65_9MICO|nr:hypothetical protein [Leucobacter exalbidus]
MSGRDLIRIAPLAAGSRPGALRPCFGAVMFSHVSGVTGLMRGPKN